MSLKDQALQAYAPKAEQKSAREERASELAWLRCEKLLREALDNDQLATVRLNIVQDAIVSSRQSDGRVAQTTKVWRLRADDLVFGIYEHAESTGPHLELLCTKCGERGWTSSTLHHTSYNNGMEQLGKELTKADTFICAACKIGVPSNCPTCGRSH